MRTRFRKITERHGMIWRGPAGWAEWSPFEDYYGPEIVPWLRAAIEQATQPWPAPRRDEIPVNVTIPVVAPEMAHRLAIESGCRTAKIKVAEPGQSPADDLARVAAVRDALGPDGRIRVDANGGWGVDEAFAALRELSPFGLEYAEQPCPRVEDLAALRSRLRAADIAVPIAADESIRRAEDPYRVAELEAADIAILKVQPLGGVRACLEIADKIGLPVVVSSAVETSVGIRAGIALAAALPELPYACGLNTIRLLTDDLGRPPLIADAGVLPVDDLDLDPAAIERCVAPDDLDQAWQLRLADTLGLAGLELDDLGVQSSEGYGPSTGSEPSGEGVR
ncbi:o-succinylbenzoate synthase [Microlunatus elymi]|nr:o-succinylbenzoate synthase [Microlunatus elymi]